MSKYTIAIDVMGGDYGPSVTVPAAIQVLREDPELRFILVGDEPTIREYLAQFSMSENERLIIRHTTETVGMDEQPALALRTKKDSSMRVAINLVGEEMAQACVSAGNTGALMATAHFVLKMLPGIDRPAILATLPTANPQFPVRLLDLGANVDSSSEHLFQFAVMASVLTQAVDEIREPRVALLNIGKEAIKGNDQVKQAAQLLAQNHVVNYIGYIEGNDIIKGIADIVVCDGFVGNITLKVSEGVSQFIISKIKLAFKRNWFTRLIGLLAMPILNKLANDINPDYYNGASLIGLRGIVIKSHGGANEVAFAHAIRRAKQEIQKNVPQQISKKLSELLAESGIE